MNVGLKALATIGFVSIAVVESFGYNGLNTAYNFKYGGDRGWVIPSNDDEDGSRNTWTKDANWPQSIDANTDCFIIYAYRNIAMQSAISEAEAVAFRGKSLRVAGELRNLSTFGKWSNVGDNIIMLGGSQFFWSSIGSVTGTKMTVDECNETYPVYFTYNGRSDKVGIENPAYFRPAIASGADAVVYWQHNANGAYGGKFILSPAWPEFNGTLHLQSADNYFEAGTFSLPGKMVLEDSVSFSLTSASGNSNLGSLSISAGAKFSLSTANNRQTVTIADRLEIASGAVLNVNKFGATAGDGGTPQPVFILSSEAVAAGVPDFEKVKFDKSAYYSDWLDCPRLRWVKSELPDGGASVAVAGCQVVTFTNSTGKFSTPFCEDGSDANSPVHFLSDGRPFHDDADYYSADQNLNVYAMAYPYEFPGNSLTANGSAILFYGDFVCKDLAVGAAARFRMMESGKQAFAGRLVARKNPTSPTTVALYVDVGNRATYVFDSDIAGDGDIVFRLNPEWDSPVNFAGGAELKGDNAKFSGKMTLIAGKRGDFKSVFDDRGLPTWEPSAVSNVTVRVWDGHSLGGSLTEFAADALAVNNACRLSFMETATFDEPTRGWSFNGTCYANVAADKTATVKQTLTLADGAVLVKEGEGCLLLGSEPQVPVGALVKPLIRVSEGGLGFSSTMALKGLDAEFAPGAKMVVKVKTTDAELQSKGLLLGDSSLNSTGALMVAFDAQGLGDDESVTVGVLTAANGAAAGEIMGRLSPGRIRGHSVRFEVVPNGDGSATIVAKIEPSGFILLFR